jgi:hypothetical protein
MKQQQRMLWESYACICFPPVIGAVYGQRSLVSIQASLTRTWLSVLMFLLMTVAFEDAAVPEWCLSNSIQPPLVHIIESYFRLWHGKKAMNWDDELMRRLPSIKHGSLLS